MSLIHIITDFMGAFKFLMNFSTVSVYIFSPIFIRALDVTMSQHINMRSSAHFLWHSALVNSTVLVMVSHRSWHGWVRLSTDSRLALNMAARPGPPVSSRGLAANRDLRRDSPIPGVRGPGHGTITSGVTSTLSLWTRVISGERSSPRFTVHGLRNELLRSEQLASRVLVLNSIFPRLSN